MNNLPVKDKTPVKSSHNVMGMVHPYRPDYQVKGIVAEGTTVYSAINQACKSANISKRLVSYGVAQIGYTDNERNGIRWEFVPVSQWKRRKIKAGELLRFRLLPQGGGGGGNKTNSLLMIGVAIAAIVTSALTYGALAPAWGATWATIGAGIAGLAVTTIGMALVNAIAPITPPSLGGFGQGKKETDVYSISSGRNQIKQWQRVPVPVGQGRFAPPLAASSYTQLRGEDQYLHELFCLGIGDMSISDIKIGSSLISKFDEALWEIMTYNPASPRAPKYYPTGVLEENLNIQLKANEDNQRTTYECDYAEVDIAFQGLCRINDSGGPESTQVCFNLAYRRSGSTDWNNVGRSKYIAGKTIEAKSYGPKGIIGVNYNSGPFLRKTLSTSPGSNEIMLGTFEVRVDTMEIDGTVYETVYVTLNKQVKSNGFDFDGFDFNLTYGGRSIAIAGGNIRTFSTGTGTLSSQRICITGAQTRLLRKTFTLRFPSRGRYDISLQRLTPDSPETAEGNRIRNESYWSSLRSITNDLPVKTSYPVMLLSVRIKASGQLSGAIDTLTVFYQTRCYDFDKYSNTWKWRYTSNPASICRYLLQQKDAFSRWQSDSFIDLPNFQAAHTYFEQRDFTYDKVMDADISVFERLCSICASALSSPTMLDGKWAIIIDKPRDNVACAFTSANAWDWSFERTQIRLPNAIHCNFINRDTWDADMRVVPTDEPNVGNYLSETQEYDGVTNPKQVYQLARFHYADAKMRRRTIHFKCYDEAILCTRGDLVELACPNISVAGLQVGRIRKITRNEYNQVVSFTTDQINTTDLSGRNFGVKIYSDNGQIFHAQIRAENQSHRKLTLIAPREMNIQEGNKYAFGDYNEEVFQAIVLSMKFNNDWTCDIVCQDYTPSIYGDLSRPVPEWHSVITRPIDHKWGLYGSPIIVRAVSDETALIKGIDGVLYCRILVYVNDPYDIDPRAAYYQAEIRQILDETDPENVIYGNWYMGANMVPINQSFLAIENVDEGALYQIRVRYASQSGEVGEWSPVFDHTVSGKLNPPRDVKNFIAYADNPNGIRLEWDLNTELDIAHYLITGPVVDRQRYSPIVEKVYKRTGIISFFIVAVDTGNRVSPNPVQADVEVLPPRDVFFVSSRLLDEGIVTEWVNYVSTWDIDYVKLRCGNAISNFTGTSGVIPYTGKFTKGTRIYAVAKDIFDNWGKNETHREITIFPPRTPQVKLGFNKLTGMITLDWQDCRNPTLENTPQIDHYEIWGTLVENDPMVIKGTHYESIIPLKVYEGKTEIVDGVEINVGNVFIRVNAVDKYGITSQDASDYVDNQINFAIYPPKNPSNFGVSASLSDGTNLEANWTQSTAIMLTWADCERTFAIDYYTVYDKYTDTNYKVSTNYVILPARKEGSYEITVKAFDVLGQESSGITYNLEIVGVGGMNVKGKIDGTDILLEWNTPSAAFQIDHYVIFADNDDLPTGTNEDHNRQGYIGQAKFNYFRMPARQVGTKTYYVWAVDVAGNINSAFANYVSITIDALPAPTVSARLQENGVGLSWSIGQRGEKTLPPAQYELRRYKKLNSVAEIPLKTPVSNYGTTSAVNQIVPAFLVGTYSFAIRAIDSGGNYGAWGLCDFVAKAPGQVTFVNTVVIDNNVQLYWTPPNVIFFPIKEYIFEEIDEETDFPMLIGNVDAQFATEVEDEAGIYTYAITPVDMGGNRGLSNRVTLRVSQPPDFVVFDDKMSLFNGEKINFYLDRKGHMFGPVVGVETWLENIERMTELAGKDITTHEEKIEHGWQYWPDPLAEGDATYIETTDHGALIPSSNFVVTLGFRLLYGNPIVTCKIEVSTDGEEWRTVTENGLAVYITQFRYSRITLTVSGGLVQFNSIQIKLSIKKLTDYGSITCGAEDNGVGWVSEAETPMLTGTWVPFRQKFVDVQSLPKPNVMNNPDYSAFTVFEDVLEPKGFRIFVKDKNGNRVTAKVSWIAMGV